MAAISSFLHDQFIKHVQSNHTLLDKDELLTLQKDVQELEQLYVEYQFKLSQLRQLIRQYETVQKKTRIKLRKKQVLSVSNSKKMSEQSAIFTD